MKFCTNLLCKNNKLREKNLKILLKGINHKRVAYIGNLLEKQQKAKLKDRKIKIYQLKINSQDHLIRIAKVKYQCQLINQN